MPKGAVIGFGQIAGQGKQLFIAMRSASIDVVAACDKDPTAFGSEAPVSKESWAGSFPTLAEVQSLPPEIYYDYRQLFKGHPKLNIVCVATNTSSHAEIVIAAAKSGAKAILCEEPMATSLTDAKAIIRACQDRDVLLTVHHTRRWWLAHQEVRNLIQQGKIGELRSIYISCGGARLGMLGAHWIDFARWITGDEVYSVTGWLGKITESEPRGQQFLDYPGEILIVFKSSVKAFIEQGEDIALTPRYEIVGTTGRISNTQYAVPTAREDWRIEVLKDPTASPVRNYMGETERLELPVSQGIDWRTQGVQAIRELLEGKTSCDGKDGYKTLEALVAAHISHGYPVLLPLRDDKAVQYTLQHA